MTTADDSWCICGHHKNDHNANGCTKCECKKFIKDPQQEFTAIQQEE